MTSHKIILCVVFTQVYFRYVNGTPSILVSGKPPVWSSSAARRGPDWELLSAIIYGPQFQLLPLCSLLLSNITQMMFPLLPRLQLAQGRCTQGDFLKRHLRHLRHRCPELIQKHHNQVFYSLLSLFSLPQFGKILRTLSRTSLFNSLPNKFRTDHF